MSDGRPADLKGAGYEIFFLALSLLSISNLAIVVLAPGVAREVALLIEVTITPFFLADFLYRLLTTRPRSRYVLRRGGWADLLAVVPLLRVFRLYRIGAVIRGLRALGLDRIAPELFVSRASATFMLTIFLVIAVLEFAGIGEFYAEKGVAGANIRSAGDALWWGLVTITTVGYGDQYPVGTPGRLVGALLLFAGIGLFSVLTGFIANLFLAPNRPPRLTRVTKGTVGHEFAELHRLLGEQERQVAAIRAMLNELERAVLPTADARAAEDARPVAAGDEG
jgi:voltage-gated potassium channel